jgi:hypothetical protein
MGTVTAGDHLFTYYQLYYLEVPASIDTGISLFVNGNVSAPYTYAGMHHYMVDNGFWLPSGVQWAPLHPGVIPWLQTSTENSLIFNNGGVQLYRRI